MTTDQETHPTPPPQPYAQDTPCPKCGSRAVTSEMCTRTTDPTIWLTIGSLVAQCWWDAWLLPHLHRDCQNCGWTFYQRPLDSDPGDYTPEHLADRKAEHERKQEERQRAREEVWKAADAFPVRAGQFDTPDDKSGPSPRRWFRRST